MEWRATHREMGRAGESQTCRGGRRVHRSAVTGHVSAPPWDHHRSPCDVKISSHNCFWDIDRDDTQMHIKQSQLCRERSCGRELECGWE